MSAFLSPVYPSYFLEDARDFFDFAALPGGRGADLFAFPPRLADADFAPVARLLDFADLIFVPDTFDERSSSLPVRFSAIFLALFVTSFVAPEIARLTFEIVLVLFATCHLRNCELQRIDLRPVTSSW